MVSKKEDADGDQTDCGEQQEQANGAGNSFYLRTEQVGASCEQRCPTYSTKGVHEQEMRPAHAVYAREESGEGSKKGDEPPDEDYLAAVSQKQVLPHLEPRFREADVSAVPRD